MFVSDSKEKSPLYVRCDPQKMASLPRAQREEELQEVKERLLNSPSIPISEKQFLLLHGDTFLGDSLYSGGNIFDNVDYILSELRAVGTESSLLYWGLTLEERDEWIQDCEDIKESRDCWNSRGSVGAKRCIDFINERLARRNKCVFPILIRGKSDDEGHVFLAVFIKDEKGDIFCHFIDKGEASDFFPVAAVSDTKIKQSYCFYPIRLTNKKILNGHSDVGITFFTKLLAYRHDPCPFEAKTYESKEILALFLQVGEIVYETNAPLNATTPQRSGTCSMQALTLLYRFNALRSDPTSDITDKRKRVKFLLRFRSLLSAVQNLSFDEPGFRYYVRLSLQGFTASLQKHYPKIISDEEFILGRALAELVQDKLNLSLPTGDNAIETLNCDTPPPLLFPPLEISSSSSPSSSSPKERYRGPEVPQYALHDLQDPAKLHETVVYLIKYLEQHGEDRDDKFISSLVAEVFSQLPVPTLEPDDFWEKIEAEEIPSLVLHLKNLARLGLAANAQHHTFSKAIQGMQSLVITFSALAAVHRLCLRLPELQLARYSVSPPFGQIENLDLFFPLGNEWKHYQKLKAYFAAVGRGKVDLFKYVEPCTSYYRGSFDGHFKKAVESYERNRDHFNDAHFQGILPYIASFADKAKVVQTFGSTAEKYALILSRHLPDEFYILQYLVALSFLEHHAYELHDFVIQTDSRDLGWQWHDKEGYPRSYRQNFKFRLCHPEVRQSDALPLTAEAKENENSLATHPPAPPADPDAWIKPPEIWTHTKVVRSLAKLYLKDTPNIKLSALLTWLFENKMYYEIDVVQIEIKKMLFSGIDWEQTAATKPHLIEHLRQFLDERIAYLEEHPSQAETSLFWLQLTYEVESRMLYIPDQQEQAKERIAALQERVDIFLDPSKQFTGDGLKILLALKIYLHTHEKSLDPSTLTELFAIYIDNRSWEVSLQDSSYAVYQTVEFLSWKVRSFLQVHLFALQKAWGSEPGLVVLGLKRVEQKYGLSGNWLGEFPNYSCEEIDVDVGYPLVTTNGNAWGLGRERNSKKKIKQEFFSLPKDAKVLDFSNKEVIVFQGQQLEVIEDQKLTLRTAWSCEGEVLTYESVDPGESKTLFCRALSEQTTLWKPVTGSDHYLLINRSRKPFARVAVKEEGVVIEKLDNQGRCTGEILSNLADFNSPFLDLIDKEFRENCLIWQKEGHVSSVEFPGRVAFTVKKGRLFHEELNLYLALKHPLPFKNCSLPLLVLESEEGEKFFLLIDRLKKSSQPYWIYTQGVSGHLTSKDTESLLLLVFYLVESDDYDSALDYLKRLTFSHSYSKEARSYISSMLDSRARQDPIRSSFRLHLALHAMENENLMTKEFFQEKNGFLDEELIDVVSDYEFLLSIMSSNSLHRVPEAFCLSLEQRELLVKSLSARSVPLSTLVEKELTSFTFPLGFSLPSNVKLPTYQFDCKPAEFASLKLEVYTAEELNSKKNKNLYLQPQYRIGEVQQGRTRITLKEIEQNFFATYHFLKESSIDPALKDMVLLQLATSLGSSEYSVYKLLALVATFPTHFPDLELGLELYGNAFVNHYNIYFNQIVECAMALEHQVVVIPKGLAPPPDDSCALPPRTPLVKEEPYPYNWSISEDFEGSPQFPLKSLCSPFYSEEERLPAENGQFFEQTHRFKSPIAQTLFSNLQKGHIENTQKKVRFFDFHGDLHRLENTLQRQISADSLKLEALRSHIEELANRGFDDSGQGISVQELLRASQEQIRLLGEKKERLTLFNHLYIAFLTKDGSLLKRHNPALQDSDIESIFNKMMSYMLTGSRLDQAKQAQSITEKMHRAATERERANLHQDLATLLSKERSYSPNAAPFFLLYEYATGMVLRKEQVELLGWIATEKDEHKREQLLIEFQAGGGKTKVVSALLAFLAIQAGMLPIYFSLPALEDVTKEDLKESLSLFNLKIKVLELTLHTHLSAPHLDHILKNLVSWTQEGCVLHIVPEAFHSLQLQFQSAMDEQRLDEIPYYIKIFDHFKLKGFFIVDELHRNASSTEVALIATGEGPPLSQIERTLFVECYKALTGEIENPMKLKDGRRVDRILNLKDNQQAMVSEKDLTQVLERLAEYLAAHPLLGIPAEDQPEIAAYIFNAQLKCPEKYSRHLPLFHARGLVTEILRPVLRMAHGFDYGASIRERDEIESPQLQKNVSLAQFDNPDISSALCCQGLYQRGLSGKQIKILLGQLWEDAKEAFNESIREENIPQMAAFIRWQSEAGIVKPISLADIREAPEGIYAELAKKMGRNPEVIERYLSFHLLGQVKVYLQKFKSTAPDMMGGSAFTLAVSATVGFEEEYPLGNSALRSDYAFQAAAIARAYADANHEILWLDPRPRAERQARDLFDLIWKRWDYDRKRFMQLSGLIDSGGWNKDFTTEETAEAFLDAALEHEWEYDGSLYITESSSPSKEKEMVLVLQGEKGKRKRYVLKGSNFLAELKTLGFSHPEKLKIFKIYGPSQCTGTDLYLESDAKMIQTFGETSTLFFLIQAFMRNRQILKPVREPEDYEWMQRVVWAGPSPLQEEMEGYNGLFPWSLEKEAYNIEQRILARSMQGIVYVARAWLWAKIKQCRQPTEVCELYRQHHCLYKEVIERNLEKLYAYPDVACDTAQVLQDFADDFFKNGNISSNDLSPDEKEKVAQLIGSAAQLIPTFNQKLSPTIGTVVSQQTVDEHQKDLDQTHSLAQAQVAGVIKEQRKVCQPKNNAAALLRSGAFQRPESHKEITSARKLFNSPLLAAEMYFLSNTYTTYDDAGLGQIKPIDFFLLVIDPSIEGSKKYIYACSHFDAQILAKELEKSSHPPLQMALMTSHGLLDTNGKESSSIDPEWFDENGPWLQQMRVQLSFCNGRVQEIEGLHKQVALWSACEEQRVSLHALWDEVRQRQACSEFIQSSLIVPLLPEKSPLPLEQGPSIEPPKIDQGRPETPREYTKIANCKGKVTVVSGLVVLFLSAAGGVSFFFFPLGPTLGLNAITLPFVLVLGAGVPSGLILVAIGSVVWHRKRVPNGLPA